MTLPGTALGVWSVAALVHAIGDAVQAGFSSCTVRGDVASFSRSASGHCYFNLKDPDSDASIRCAMFRRAAQLSAFVPAEGDAVEVRGRVAVYEPRGELQLVVEAARRSGAGALYERYLVVKARLEAEGLFDAASRRPLPRHPAVVGVVTSLGGAALHDVATALARRAAHLQVFVYPSLVQGPDAPAALCTAIASAARHGACDVLLVCRGGGSLEDLWAFNDEAVVRAIRASPIPVLSGVGHETDVTLADLAADLRAPTPTAAAEIVARPTSDAQADLDAFAATLRRTVRDAIEREQQRMDRAAARLASPAAALQRQLHAIDLLEQRLATTARRRTVELQRGLDAFDTAMRLAGARSLQAARSRLDGVAWRLAAVDPSRTLARGFALLRDPAGRAITGVAALRTGQRIAATLADGEALLTVDSVALR